MNDILLEKVYRSSFLIFYQEEVSIFRSNGRKALIHFQATRLVRGLGFIISYTAVPEPGAGELLIGLVQVFSAWL